MAAFVSTPTWRLHRNSKTPTLSPLRRNLTSTTITPRRQIARMSDAPNDDTTSSNASADMSSTDETEVETASVSGPGTENIIFDDEIKEPYPGFFADMSRMGMSDEEARAQALKQMNQANPVKSNKVGGAKSLFREDGTAYAPWMADFPTEYSNKVIKNRTDATGRLAADPQLGELSGVGLTYRMVGDDIELLWATGSEEGNKGFVIYKRKGKASDWEKITDYRSKPVELKSKGPEGGKYSFLIEEPSAGTWVYRVSDVDANDNVSDLSQVLIELESPEDSKFQKVALIGLIVLFAIAFAIGVSLDPQS